MFFRSDPVILSPDGEDYSGIGIPPDVPVADRRKPDRDDVLEEALRVLRHRKH
jgi:C-terminal processing protease CtpA/Prc